VPHDFDALDIMFTSSIVLHLHDIDRETFDSALLSTFVYEIIVLDRVSNYGRRDTKTLGSRGGDS
jgi:hypothetical protein